MTLPLRTSALRSLGAYGNVFAIESFMDELAEAAGVDPIAFRLRHLTDERATAVLVAVAEWLRRTEGDGNPGHGRGVAFAQYKNLVTYAAVAVELEVTDAAEVRLHRAVIAADAGQVVDPNGLTAQLEGGLLQAASWTLYEQVTYDRGWHHQPRLGQLSDPAFRQYSGDRDRIDRPTRRAVPWRRRSHRGADRRRDRERDQGRHGLEASSPALHTRCDPRGGPDLGSSTRYPVVGTPSRRFDFIGQCTRVAYDKAGGPRSDDD